MAIQRARGVPVRAAPAPPPAPFQAIPPRVTLQLLMACCEPVVYARGLRYLDLRPVIHSYALLALMRRHAYAVKKGRRRGATIRRSIRLLVQMMAPACGWDTEEDTWEARDRHESSIRRWLQLLVDAGLLSCERVVDELDQDRGTDFTLLVAPVPPDEALETAGNRLARWRKRYGDDFERSRVAGRVIAYLAATRKTIDEKYRCGGRKRPRRKTKKHNRRGPKNTFGALPSGDLSALLKGTAPPPSGESAVASAQRATASDYACASGRETDCGMTRLDGLPDSELEAALNAIPGSSALREEGGAAWLDALNGWLAPHQEGLAGRWTARIAEAEEICRRHVPTASDPLPALPALRLAVAGRLYGAAGLLEDPTIPAIPDRLMPRLLAAARRHLHYATPEFYGRPDPADERSLPQVAGTETGVPSPADVLLSAAANLRPENRAIWPQLVAAFRRSSRSARRYALNRGEAGVRRDQARHRDAERHRLAVLHYWPDWIVRDGDQFVVMGHTRAFVQVHRLPTRQVLESEQLRRWLQAATALMWGVVPSTIEFSDPDGLNAEVPVDLAKAGFRGERTRGADVWKAKRRRRR